MNTVFSEFSPSKILLPYVQSYWQGTFNLRREENFQQSVLPNGCIELIIHTDSEHCALSKDQKAWSSSPEFILLGLYEQPYEVRFSEKVNVFGIRFYPDGIRNIFGIPPVTFMATYENGLDVLGKELAGFCSRVREAANVQQMIMLADEFIRRQLALHAKAYDYTHQAMQLIRQGNGTKQYKALTDEVPVSPRQLQREFRSQYGLTVRDYMRLIRLNAINRYMQAPAGSLTGFSHELNFTDQAHFNREFKHYAKVAPRKLIKEQEHYIINPALEMSSLKT